MILQACPPQILNPFPGINSNWANFSTETAGGAEEKTVLNAFSHSFLKGRESHPSSAQHSVCPERGTNSIISRTIEKTISTPDTIEKIGEILLFVQNLLLPLSRRTITNSCGSCIP